jgi:hypothetical protein
MHCLQINIEKILLVNQLDRMPSSSEFDPEQIFPHDREILFYDWLEDTSTGPCGIELHLFRSNPFYDLLKSNPIVDFGEFPRIFIDACPSPKARTLEAFGDILLVQTARDSATIFVGLDTWLSESDRQYLDRVVARGQHSAD